METLPSFEKALDFYFNQQFAGAYQALNIVLQRNPQAHTAKMFLQKVLHFMDHGAPEGWTGVEMMTQK